MTPENFCYWLQGYSELCGEAPTIEQWELINEHLKLVFSKVTQDIHPQVAEEYEGIRYMPIC